MNFRSNKRVKNKRSNGVVNAKRSNGVMECWSNAAQHSTTPPLHQSTNPPLCRAFSLIEMIGVLAVIAILAAVLVPNVIRRIDQAAWQKETSDLKVMADALVKTSLTEKTITNQTRFPEAIAKYLDLPVNQVNTNAPRNFKRFFLADPNMNVNGTNANANYIQGINGSATQPVNARMMIISTLARALPASVTSINATDFAAIWDTPNDTVPGWLSSPSGGNWTGKAEDLCIQRADFGGLFHKLSLLNIDPANDGYFSFEDKAQIYVPSVLANGGQAANRTIYVLDGTAVNLFKNVGADLQLRVILSQDQSFVYQNNQWSRSLLSDQVTPLDPYSFGWWVNEFLKSPYPPDPEFGATQRATIDEFYTYLWGYWSWAQASGNNTNFWLGQAPGDPASPANPYFRAVTDSQANFNTFTGNLIK